MFNDKFNTNDKTEASNLKKYLKLGAYSLTGLIIAWNSFVTIDETQVGIDYTFGKLTTKSTEDLRTPGFNPKFPWTTVKKVRVDLQHMDIKEMRTNTKDNQQITMDNTVFFKLAKNQVINIYRNNPDWDSKLESGVISSVKSALGQTEAEKVAFQRDKIMMDVTKETQHQIKQSLGIDVQQVLMPNYDFDKPYQNAVSGAAIQKAELVKKQTQLEQSSIDAKRTIVGAQAKADAERIAADAQAYVTTKTKDAEAAGFSRVQSVIGMQNMATYLTTSRWNGVGPVAVGTANISDVSKLVPAMR